MKLINNQFMETIQTLDFKTYFENSNIRIQYHSEKIKWIEYTIQINCDYLKSDVFYKHYNLDLIIYMYYMYSPNRCITAPRRSAPRRSAPRRI